MHRETVSNKTIRPINPRAEAISLSQLAEQAKANGGMTGISVSSSQVPTGLPGVQFPPGLLAANPVLGSAKPGSLVVVASPNKTDPSSQLLHVYMVSAKNKERLFSGCSARRRWSDLSLCTVEALLLVSIIILLTVEAWQVLALGKDYFLELENWFELLVLGLASCTMGLKAELDILAIVASVGICLAWIELIFLFGRYPSLGGSFSIMYYSITKRVVKTALGLILLVFAFAFAFFIIHFDNSNESFEDVPKSLVKSFVMVLGEFEFNDLWESSESASSGLSQVFTMMLLVGLIMFGTIIMINLIVAIIITDIAWLQKVSKQQVLRNQAHHAVQIHALQSMFKCLSTRVVDTERSLSRQLEVWVCVHSVCKCGRMRPASDTRERLLEIINNDSGSGKY